MPEIQNKKLQAWALLILLSLIWGSSFILIKKGLIHLAPGEVGALRIVSAAIFLAPFAIKNLTKIPNDKWVYLILIGLLGSFIPSFLFAVAQTNLPSSLTGVINALTPIFTLIIGVACFSQSQSSKIYLGLGLGFVGTSILILANENGGLTLNPYGLLIVLATIMYAFNLNIIKAKMQGLNAVMITSISLLFMGPFGAIYLFGYTDFMAHLNSGTAEQFSIFLIVILGVVGTAIALIIFNRIVQLTSPIFTSSVTYFIPLVAVLWGVWDGEIVAPLHFLGMAITILGVYLTNKKN